MTWVRKGGVWDGNDVCVYIYIYNVGVYAWIYVYVHGWVAKERILSLASLKWPWGIKKTFFFFFFFCLLWCKELCLRKPVRLEKRAKDVSQSEAEGQTFQKLGVRL